MGKLVLGTGRVKKQESKWRSGNGGVVAVVVVPEFALGWGFPEEGVVYLGMSVWAASEPSFVRV